MWSNIKTVVEEHMSSENVLYSATVDDHDKVYMYHQQPTSPKYLRWMTL